MTGPIAWLAGAVSGFLGGLVGNQGGIRSAALLGFQTTRLSFVATATAVALLVDVARMPVYAVTQHQQLVALLAVLGVASAGVLIGTVAGKGLLARLPERVFRSTVSLLLLVLGIYMLQKGLRAL